MEEPKTVGVGLAAQPWKLRWSSAAAPGPTPRCRAIWSRPITWATGRLAYPTRTVPRRDCFGGRRGPAGLAEVALAICWRPNGAHGIGWSPDDAIAGEPGSPSTKHGSTTAGKPGTPSLLLTLRLQNGQSV